MKIWMLTTEYPPFYGGGIATYCVNTARMLVSNGHEVTVFICDSALEETRKVMVEEGVRVVRFKPGFRDIYQYLGYHAALSYDFSETVQEFISEDGKPDIIESQDYLGLAYFLLQKKRTLWPNLEDVPIAVALHTPGFLSGIVAQAPVYRFPDFWVGEMERFAIRAADGRLFSSQYLPSQLTRHICLDGLDSYTVRYPFQAPPPVTKDDSRGRADTADNIVVVGRLQYLKGVVQTLDYFGRLWDDGLKTTLTLTGTDTYFHPRNCMMSAYLQKKYHRYFAEGLVNYPGALPPKEFGETLRRARIIIMPSLFENFPYVVAECMALGKVLLASDSGGQRELIEDGKNGFLFSHDQRDHFRSKLMRILEMPEREATEIGLAARLRVAEMCSYESVYPEKIRALEDICGKRQRGRSFPFTRVRQKAVADRPQLSPQGSAGLLSIVIPYYNMGTYVRETLDSLIRSSYTNKEIIIINDGSDNAESIAALYQIEKEYPVRVVHKTNGGLASARNAGAHAANGEFLAFLDADDMVAPDYHRWAIRIMDAYDNVSFVGCWAEWFGGQKMVWPAWNPEPPYLLLHNPMNTSSLVFRRRDFLDFGLNDLQLEYGIEDYESLIRMVEHGCMGVAIPKPLFQWRVRPDSLSRGVGRESTLYLYSLLTRKHAELYKEYATDLFNLLNANGPSYLYDNPSRELPPIGFVQSEHVQTASQFDASSAAIPSEVKRDLALLWQRPLFRKALKTFFRLHLERLF